MFWVNLEACLGLVLPNPSSGNIEAGFWVIILCAMPTPLFYSL